MDPFLPFKMKGDERSDEEEEESQDEAHKHNHTHCDKPDAWTSNVDSTLRPYWAQKNSH